MWEAEQTIAERYSVRVRLIVTQAITLFGATTVAIGTVLIKIDWNKLSTSGVIFCVSILFILYGLSAFKIIEALVSLLHSSQYPTSAIKKIWNETKKDSEELEEPKPPTSSYELELPDQYLDWLEEELDPETQIIFSQILHAAIDLRKRNLRERFRLKAGESSIVWGFWVVVHFESQSEKISGSPHAVHNRRIVRI
jgi:hypothetical protein